MTQAVQIPPRHPHNPPSSPLLMRIISTWGTHTTFTLKFLHQNLHINSTGPQPTRQPTKLPTTDTPAGLASAHPPQAAPCRPPQPTHQPILNRPSTNPHAHTPAGPASAHPAQAPPWPPRVSVAALACRRRPPAPRHAGHAGGRGRVPTPDRASGTSTGTEATAAGDGTAAGCTPSRAGGRRCCHRWGRHIQ